MKTCAVPEAPLVMVSGPPPEDVISVETVLRPWDFSGPSSYGAVIRSRHDDLCRRLAEKTDKPARALYEEVLPGNTAVRLTLTT